MNDKMDMSKTVFIADGLLTLAGSKAACPHCARKIPFDEIDDKWQKQGNNWMRMKCKCKRMIGISTDMRGDFVAFSIAKPDL